MEQVKQLIARLTANRRNLMVVVVVVLAAEVVWAAWTLSKPVQEAVQNAPTVSTTSKANSSLTSASLKVSGNTVKVGEKVTLTMALSSTKQTDGTDLIVLYSPKLLSPVVEGAKALVTVGSLYSEYPINTVDEKTGRIVISGITTAPGGVVAEGILGTITFVAKAAGKTSFTLDFTPGSTADSNIVETSSAKDILDEVRNVELTIVP